MLRIGILCKLIPKYKASYRTLYIQLSLNGIMHYATLNQPLVYFLHYTVERKDNMLSSNVIGKNMYNFTSEDGVFCVKNIFVVYTIEFRSCMYILYRLFLTLYIVFSKYFLASC